MSLATAALATSGLILSGSLVLVAQASQDYRDERDEHARQVEDDADLGVER